MERVGGGGFQPLGPALLPKHKETRTKLFVISALQGAGQGLDVSMLPREHWELGAIVTPPQPGPVSFPLSVALFFFGIW